MAGHFDQAEFTDRKEGGSGSIPAEVVGESFLEFLAVPGESHVDEVADDEAALISQSKLSCNLIDRFPIGRHGVGFGILGASATAGVDVDRHHGLRLIDHQSAT